MSEYSTEERKANQRARQGPSEKLIYVMPEQAFSGDTEYEVSLKELWGVLWSGKWLIAVMTTAFAVGSITYALLATEWYRAEVLLAPSEADSVPSIAGQLGGLATLAGVSVSRGGAAESVATLKSRDLAREFIESNGLMPVLLHEDWDQADQTLQATGEEETPDIRDAARVFHDKVLKVQEDRDSGLVTVVIEWIDPHLAADWASKVVELANARLRQRALREAERNVAYLQTELGSTSVVTLQQSIGRLLETEMQKLMLAKKSEEFAFRTVDAAEPPKRPFRPRRAIVAVVGTLLGAAISVLLVFIRHALCSNPSKSNGQQSNI